jgi:hypothetical protein
MERANVCNDLSDSSWIVTGDQFQRIWGSNQSLLQLVAKSADTIIGHCGAPMRGHRCFLNQDAKCSAWRSRWLGRVLISETGNRRTTQCGFSPSFGPQTEPVFNVEPVKVSTLRGCLDSLTLLPTQRALSEGEPACFQFNVEG